MVFPMFFNPRSVDFSIIACKKILRNTGNSCGNSQVALCGNSVLKSKVICEKAYLSHHSLVRHDLLDVAIEEGDDDGLPVSTDVFPGAVCEGYDARAITVHFLYLKTHQSQ